MRSFGFIVPGKPQGKGRARSAVRGRFVRHYTPEKTVLYERQIAQSAAAVFSGEPHAGLVSIKIEIVIPWPAGTSKIKRATETRAPVKPDIDNVLKAILDGLNKLVWLDDAQVIECSATKRRGDTGFVAVTVNLLDDGGGNG